MASGGSRGGEPKTPRTARRMKGLRVWLDMDQAELDAAYDQRLHAPNRQEVLARYVTRSDEARRRLGPPQRFAYGPSPVEGLDLYATDRPGAPINVFLHGGAWSGERAHDYAFPGEKLVSAGAHWIVPDFARVQDVGGSLAVMAEQVRGAVAWVRRHAASFGGDPDRIYVSGHSSGGHLAGVVLTTDWPQVFDLPADTVKGGLCCSGMFDLRPVRLSARGAYVAFTDEVEEALSPQRHLDRLTAPLIVAYGTRESPEFQRQSRDFGAALRAAGRPVTLIVGGDYNHFEMLETLGDPRVPLGRALFEQMGLEADAATDGAP